VNKRIAIVSGFILVVLLAGCASAAPTAVSQAPAYPPAQDQPQNRPTGGPLNLTLENKLAIGTFKLEGTDKAVTAQEAGQLLPLWQQVGQLTTNGDTNTGDYLAVYQKIEAAMTSDQIQTIQNLSLTNADIRGEMQSLGIQGGFGGGGSQNLTPDQRATRIAQFGANGTPGARPRFQGTPNSNRTPGAGGFGGGMMRNPNAIFVQPLIQLLQTRAGGQ
jgi:hypothetical protein